MYCSVTYKLTAALVLLAWMTQLPTNKVDAGESTSSANFESTQILAEQGNAAAQYELGNAYCYSDNVEANYSGVLDWYREAAEQGLVDAQYLLRYLYEEGEFVDQDLSEATNWFRKVAEQEHVGNHFSLEAQFILVILYYYSDGVDQNYSEGVNWYRNAAEQGHDLAQFNLAGSHHNGEGVPRDAVKAWAWDYLTGHQGLEDAIPKRNSVYSGLSKKQFVQALELVQELKATFFPHLLQN